MKEMASTIPVGGRGLPIRWCKGYLIMIHAFEPTPEVIRKELRGELHWRYAGISPFSNFTDTIEIPEGKITIPVFDVSEHPVYSHFVDFMEHFFPYEIEEAKKEASELGRNPNTGKA